jgi:Chitobiase/beta-hexosaminidase C-terminal domain/Legume lectin domain/Putative Ig domain
MQIILIGRPGLPRQLFIAVLLAFLAIGVSHARVHRGGWQRLVISGTPATSDVAGSGYSFTPSASGPRGYALSFAVSGKPSWASFNPANGTLSGTPTSSNEGTFSNIVISVSDGASTASLRPFSITVSAPAGTTPPTSPPPTSPPNTAPTISGQPPTTATAGTPYSFRPTASDSDGDAISFSVQNLPAWASFSIATGAITGTPTSSDAGSYSAIVISVSDGISTASLPAFSIAVSDPQAPPVSSGSAGLVFSYPNGFSSAGTAIHVGSNDASQYNGAVVDVTSGTVGQHEAGAVWYSARQSVTSFTTDFTFQIAPGGYGMAFVLQNDPRGLSAVADANGLGYLTYTYNNPDNAIADSVAIVFNATPNSSTSGYWIGANPSVIGLYINGGPFINNGILPVNDLTPQGINLNSGDVMSAHVVYDGTVLSIQLTDTSTGAKASFSWPVNIPAVVGSSTAYVGFGAGTIPAVSQTLNSWTWWQGLDSRLAPPTFSPAPGAYTGSQPVTISASSGATIYYTTNGKPPNTASSVYSGPITVGSNELIQAIAVQSGYSDSLPAQGNYQIQTSGSPTINFPSGFASAHGLVQAAGVASTNGNNLQLTDGANQGEIGSAFYAAPVAVNSFTTSFTLQFNGADYHNGLMFVLQNQMPSSGDVGSKFVSGGPYTFGQGFQGYGYQGIGSSVAVKFDEWNGATGLYTDGAAPSSPQTAISGLALNSGHPIACTLTYNGTTLSLSMQDTVTHGTFSTQWTVNIPSVVGAGTAYAGFTADTYDSYTVQDVTAWTYH